MEDLDEECPICFESMAPDATAALPACPHKLCLRCAAETLKRDARCPVCRTGVYAVNTLLPCRPLPQETFTCSVKVGPKQHAGIAIVNATAEGAVRVLRVLRGDQMRLAGVRAGDLIFAINNVPVVNHHVAVDIMNQAMREQDDLTCHLWRPPSRGMFRSALRYSGRRSWSLW